MERAGDPRRRGEQLRPVREHRPGQQRPGARRVHGRGRDGDRTDGNPRDRCLAAAGAARQHRRSRIRAAHAGQRDRRRDRQLGEADRHRRKRQTNRSSRRPPVGRRRFLRAAGSHERDRQRARQRAARIQLPRGRAQRILHDRDRQSQDRSRAAHHPSATGGRCHVGARADDTEARNGPRQAGLGSRQCRSPAAITAPVRI